MNNNSIRIAVVGLGYVGLPLAVAFGRKYPVTGFDVNERRVGELRSGADRTREVSEDELRSAELLSFSVDEADIAQANVYIVTVPTPIDDHKSPDLRPLRAASATVGSVLKQGDLVIYESTVYPGCTEEVCVPILERESGLLFNSDFTCGYSPERINPGDREHRLPTIRKVTSGSTPEAARRVDELYGSIVEAGTFPVSSIRVAEAAKVIENTQRDINIAFVNELAIIFNRLGIDTQEVLEAAGTKWNFLPFRPGLVGGHCIGVDPYYLTYKAQTIGYNPEVILSGRRINDTMGGYISSQLIKYMIRKGQKVAGARVLLLGVTFKENCPDIRNSRVVDIVRELEEFGCIVDVYDPHADGAEVRLEYGFELIGNPVERAPYDAVVLAVAHDEFRGLDLARLKNGIGVVYDVKGVVDRRVVDCRL